MQEINFEVGSEERALDFIRNISSDDKVALISHTDLDGIASAKVVGEVLDLEIIKFVGYENLNESLVEELKGGGINKIILTDLMIKEEALLEKITDFAELLIVDHHLFSRDFNSDKIVFMDTHNFCASYLAYYLFSKIKNLDKLDWLVACACIADFAYKNNSNWMSEIYEKYEEKFDSSDEGIKKSRFFEIMKEFSSALIYFRKDLNKVYENIGEGFGDIGELKKYSDIVTNEIDDSVEAFYREKEVYGDVYLWVFDPKFKINSPVSTIISLKERDKAFLILGPGENLYHISARRQDRKVSMVGLLKKLIDGFEDADSGGHVPAAGGHFLKRDLPEFKRRLAEFG